jgi:RNA polymerase sigma-70 factor (ECF subfamily)
MYISIYYAKKKSSLLLRLPTRKTKRHNIADTTPSKEDELIKEQNLFSLRFIKELKPYQEVIQLRYFQEMSYQEIANKIEEPLSNVKSNSSVLKNYWQKLFEINANSPLR